MDVPKLNFLLTTSQNNKSINRSVLCDNFLQRFPQVDKKKEKIKLEITYLDIKLKIPDIKVLLDEEDPVYIRDLNGRWLTKKINARLFVRREAIDAKVISIVIQGSKTTTVSINDNPSYIYSDLTPEGIVINYDLLDFSYVKVYLEYDLAIFNTIELDENYKGKNCYFWGVERLEETICVNVVPSEEKINFSNFTIQIKNEKNEILELDNMIIKLNLST